MLLATGRKPNTQTLGLDEVHPPPLPPPRAQYTRPTPTPALNSLGRGHTARMILKPTTHDWGLGEQRVCDCSRLGDRLGGCLCTPPGGTPPCAKYCHSDLRNRPFWFVALPQQPHQHQPRIRAGTSPVAAAKRPMQLAEAAGDPAGRKGKVLSR